jgi:hypothetical protein
MSIVALVLRDASKRDKKPSCAQKLGEAPPNDVLRVHVELSAPKWRALAVQRPLRPYEKRCLSWPRLH